MPAWLRSKGERAEIHTLSVELSSEHAPVLLAALNEICDRVAHRVQAPLPFRTEDAMTQVLVPLNALRAATGALCNHRPDGDYRGGTIE